MATRRSTSPTPQARRSSAPAPGGDPLRRLQAAGHQRTRRAHAQEIGEDYAEAIADLIEGVGEARVVDLAECLGVTHVTVVRTIARLQRDGLVTARPYRSIFLTDEGRRLAERVRRRHRVVLDFLRALGVSEDAARADTEGIEHHVSNETLAAFERFSQKQRR
jgi:DtxR family manganese transport transcriptional regulator